MAKLKFNLKIYFLLALTFFLVVSLYFAKKYFSANESDPDNISADELIPADRKDFKSRRLTPQEIQSQQKIFHADVNEKSNPSVGVRPLSPVEKASIRMLVDYFLLAYDANAPGDELQESIKQLGLRPQVSINENKHTGVLKIVRTENSLPGTRYLHAQFMGDQIDKLELQNISFEIRPSPDAEAQILNVINQAYEGLGEPHEKSDGYAEWRLKDCKLLWYKRQTAEDLQDDAFNAHKLPDDVGTFVVTQEDDIHCHENQNPE